MTEFDCDDIHWTEPKEPLNARLMIVYDPSSLRSEDDDDVPARIVAIWTEEDGWCYSPAESEQS